MKISFLLISLLSAGIAFAGPPAPHQQGIEGKDYKWNAAGGEKSEALNKKGDIKAGAEAYEVCGACHLPSGAGRPDGTFPQLAGQHSTVLIKQMADIRAGLRDNPTMYPFAATLVDPQELADAAAYINSLCIPLEHGKYEGADAARQLAEGKQLYDNKCAQCHQSNGAGRKDALYPVLAGQHNKYLLRQMTEVRNGKRVDVPAEMFEAIKSYDDAQLVAVAAYQASLKTPALLMCRTPADKARM